MPGQILSNYFQEGDPYLGPINRSPLNRIIMFWKFHDPNFCFPSNLICIFFEIRTVTLVGLDFDNPDQLMIVRVIFLPFPGEQLKLICLLIRQNDVPLSSWVLSVTSTGWASYSVACFPEWQATKNNRINAKRQGVFRFIAISFEILPDIFAIRRSYIFLLHPQEFRSAVQSLRFPLIQ